MSPQKRKCRNTKKEKEKRKEGRKRSGNLSSHKQAAGGIAGLSAGGRGCPRAPGLLLSHLGSGAAEPAARSHAAASEGVPAAAPPEEAREGRTLGADSAAAFVRTEHLREEPTAAQR